MSSKPPSRQVGGTYRAINLHAGIESARLHIGEDGCLSLVKFGLEDGAGTHGASRHTQLAADGGAPPGEGVDGILSVQDEHAVVDVQAGHETKTGGVQHDANGPCPSAIVLFGNDDAGTTGSTEPQTGAHGGEDGETFTSLNDLGGDLLDDALLGRWTGGGFCELFIVEAIFAKALEDASRLFTLALQVGGPEGLGAQLVGELVDGIAELVLILMLVGTERGGGRGRQIAYSLFP